MKRRDGMNKDKLIGTAYVNIIKDDKEEIKFAYGYKMKEEELSLNDFAMLNSFLDKLKTKAKEDFEERLDVNDKAFSIEKE